MLVLLLNTSNLEKIQLEKKMNTVLGRKDELQKRTNKAQGGDVWSD